jgi:hypothetical protein
MDEAEWLASDDPAGMLRWLMAEPLGIPGGSAPFPNPSNRKLRLFAVACWRALFDTPQSADRASTRRQAAQAEAHADDPERCPLGVEQVWVFQENAAEAADNAAQLVGPPYPMPDAFALLRDIMGNPFRPVSLPWRCRECGIPCGPPAAGYYCVRCGSGEAGRCPFLTPQIIALARAAYDGELCGRCGEERFPGYLGDDSLADAFAIEVENRRCPDCAGTGRAAGLLDPLRLAILADALEEAGCSVGRVLEHRDGATHYWYNETFGKAWPHLTPGRAAEHPLLAHLRSPGPHARGCWAVDLVLGKG